MEFNLNLENINYIKISCKDKNEKPWVIKAAIKRLDTREIYTCVKFEDSIHLKTPQDVNISLACNDGLYVAKTVLKYIQIESPYMYMALVVPAKIEHRQMREYFRVKLSKKASISYNLNNRIMQQTCDIYDISANGISLISTNDLSNVGNIIVNLSTGEKSVSVEAKYKRFDTEDELLKTSFQFVNISENDRDFISQICIKQQLENKRNSVL